MKDVKITVTAITDENRKEKFLAASDALAKALNIPITLRRKDPDKESGEKFPYQAYEDLVNQWVYFYAGLLDLIYNTCCNTFDLPRVTTFSKARGSDPLIYKGKILYAPETGKPITRKQWKDFVKAIEDFLNRKVTNAGDRIVLDSTALGKVLDRMLKYNTWDAVRQAKYEELEYQKWKAGEFSGEENYRKLFKVADEEMDRMAVAQELCAEHITKVTDETRGAIKKVFLNGIKERKTKGEIAQDLFDKFGDLNRDWKRIVETETNDAMNNAMMVSERTITPEGVPLYFQRMEIIDGVTCAHCKKINGLVARWSDVPLDDEKIDDPYAKIAIWEGKSRVGMKASEEWVAAGSQHPYCRGLWTKWLPPGKKDDAVNAALAKMKGREAAWAKACSQAEAEFRAKGARKLNDATPGYVDRINEIYTVEVSK